MKKKLIGTVGVLAFTAVFTSNVYAYPGDGPEPNDYDLRGTSVELELSLTEPPIDETE